MFVEIFNNRINNKFFVDENIIFFEISYNFGNC